MKKWSTSQHNLQLLDLLISIYIEIVVEMFNTQGEFRILIWEREGSNGKLAFGLVSISMQDKIKKNSKKVSV